MTVFSRPPFAPVLSGIVHQRLASQFLTAPGPEDAATVIKTLGAVQAQDYAAAKWGLALRARGATDASLERDFTEGRFLRTHVLRPTWHFVSPADIRWMLALTGPRVAAVMAIYNPRLGLTPRVLRRCNDVIARALEGGKCLTRQELAKQLARARVASVSGQCLARIAMQAELDAVVCSGPRRGGQFTYALLDERVKPAAPLERDEALLTLALRYFRTRGPATPHDFAWWSGLTVGDARRAIAAAGAALSRVELDGVSYWVAADAPRVRPVRSALLLPNYDEYFIGFRDRTAIAERIGHAKLVTGGSALIGHVIVVDGQLGGAWSRKLVGDTASVTLRLLTRVTTAERRRILANAKRLGDFLGLRTAVSVS